MSFVITFSAIALTLDPGQQRTRIDMTYNGTFPESAGKPNTIPCQLEWSESGNEATWTPVPNSDTFDAQYGSGAKSSIYGVFPAGRQVYLRAISFGLGLQDPVTPSNSTGNVISNVFNAGFAPAA